MRVSENKLDDRNYNSEGSTIIQWVSITGSDKSHPLFQMNLPGPKTGTSLHLTSGVPPYRGKVTFTSFTPQIHGIQPG